MNESVTRVHICALQGNRAELRRLLSDASVLEVKDHFGRTPLFYATMGNSEQCLCLLLKLGARVDNGDNCGQTPLHLASHKGLKGCVKSLLAAGAVWHQRDIKGVTPLHLAAHHPNSKALSLLLDRVPPGQLDLQDACKRTALHFSASFCIPENVRMLLKQDANALIQDENGQTPLHLCASRNDPGALECARILLDRSPSLINWQDYEGQTALHLAVAEGLEEMVDFLTSRPLCDLNQVDNPFRTPLHWAATLGMASIAKLLLDRRADPRCADGNGATPLHYAAQQNDVETVNVLLSRGCPGEIGDKNGVPPLVWAADAGASDTIRALYLHGVALSYADVHRTTALHHGAARGHNGVVELLLDLGCEANVVNEEGMTPLAFASKEGHAHTLPLLLDASLEAADICGRTPVHWAAQENHACVCQLLIKRGCFVSIHDCLGMTPLHCASSEGHVSCMSVLLENGADPNILEHQGRTALHLAAKAGHLDVVELLCSYQAMVNCVDTHRLTALDYAISGGHAGVIQFLLSKGAFTSSAIEEIAARCIQSFFKKHFRRSRSGDKTTLAHTESVGDRPRTHEHESRSQGGQMARQDAHNKGMLLCTKRDTGSQTIELLERHTAPLDEKAELTREKAALRIQRAWKRYTVGQMRLRMQEKVLGLFETEQHRLQAQEEWNCFMDKLRTLGFEV